MENQIKIEEVTMLDISLIDDFEGHPFTVKDKGNQKEKISVPVERLQKYFPRGASPKQMEFSQIILVYIMQSFLHRKQISGLLSC